MRLPRLVIAIIFIDALLASLYFYKLCLTNPNQEDATAFALGGICFLLPMLVALTLGIPMAIHAGSRDRPPSGSGVAGGPRSTIGVLMLFVAVVALCLSAIAMLVR